jgi:predicted transcriptional regulator
MKWSYKEQRRLLEITASSGSLEEIAERVGRKPAAIRKKAPQLGISLKFNSAHRRSAPKLKAKAKAK